MYTAGEGGERIFLTTPLLTKKKMKKPPPPPPPPHPILTRKVECEQYDDDAGTEITDLIIALQAFKVKIG